MELLHVAINNRKNDFILRVLQEFCFNQPTPYQPEAVNMLERAILFATLNDDPETLEVILKWAKEHNVVSNCNSESGLTHSPIMYACLKDYVQCVTLLYRYGYRVSLPEVEEKIILEVLRTNDAVENDHYFYMEFYNLLREVSLILCCFPNHSMMN